MRKGNKKKMLGTVLAVMALLLLHSGAFAFVFTDNFNDNSINGSVWKVVTYDNSTVAEQNGRIEMVYGGSGSTSLQFKFPVSGDYVVEADYTLLNWPTENGIRLGISNSYDYLTYAVVERISDSSFGGEVYLTHFSTDGVQGNTGTPDISGRLKFERIGGSISGYYQGQGGNWVLIHNYSGFTTGDGMVSLNMWPGSWGIQGTTIAFDNFFLEAPDMADPTGVPEPLTILLFGTGLAGVAVSRRRGARK